MLKEIGSNFWINPNTKLIDKEIQPPIQFGCEGKDFVWLSSGRSAIRFVIKTILERNPSHVKSVLLPPFTCNTVIDPFVEAGYEIHYYNIDKNLNIKINLLLDNVLAKRVGIVLYHRYFGFDTLSGNIDQLEKIRKSGIIIIEDCTQCLYSNFNKQLSDYTIGSVRKWFGIPDGGFAVCANGSFIDKPTSYDETLEKAKKIASFNKYKYLFESIGEKSQYLQQFRDAEEILDKQRDWYSISDFSVKLQNNIDVAELSHKRFDNFNTLLNNFPNFTKIEPLFKHIVREITPLYFPIIVEDRTSLQQYFTNNDIYAPVIWPKPKYQPIVCDNAEYLYEHLLCIPIDQRYSKEDMNRVISVLQEYDHQ